MQEKKHSISELPILYLVYGCNNSDYVVDPEFGRSTCSTYVLVRQQTLSSLTSSNTAGAPDGIDATGSMRKLVLANMFQSKAPKSQNQKYVRCSS